MAPRQSTSAASQVRCTLDEWHLVTAELQLSVPADWESQARPWYLEPKLSVHKLRLHAEQRWPRVAS